MTLKSSILYGFLFLIILVSMVGVVSAVECNADLSNAESSGSCTISSSLTLNVTKPININTTSIYINANNTIFDCNNSRIYGNLSNLSSGEFKVGVTVSGFSNVTIRNCNVSNYYTAIKFYNNAKDFSVINTTLYDGRYLFWVEGNSSGNLINSYVHNASAQAITYISSLDYFNITDTILLIENAYPSTAGYFRMYNGASNAYLNNVTFPKSNSNNINAIFAIENSPYNSSGLYLNNVKCYNDRCLYTAKTNVYGFSNIYINGFLMNESTLSGNAGFWIAGANDVYISGLNISNSNNTFYISSGSNNITLANSFFSNATGTLSTQIQAWNSYNISFIQNTISGTDIGIYVNNCTNVNTINNTFFDITKYYDGWGTAINYDKDVLGGIISGNNISYSDCGVHIRKSNNITIKDNFFIRDLSQKVKNRRDASSAICISELYITWTGDSAEGSTDNRTNKIENYSSGNITISNNLFNSNVNVYLWTQGTNNLITDLTNLWFRSIQFPDYLVDRTNFYVSNLFDNITQINSHYGDGNTTILGQGYMNQYKVKFKIHKSYLYFININNSYNYTAQVFNLTSALIHTSNGTGYLCSGQCNITLPPNNYTYVFDDFSLTEGINTPNSPININSTTSTSTGKSYSITSLVSNNIAIPSTFTVDCDKVKSVIVTPNNGNAYQPGYSCIGNTLTINSLYLNYSTSSNIVLFSFLSSGLTNSFCSNVTAGYDNFFSAVIVIFSVLAIGVIIFILYGLVKVTQGEDLDTNLIESLFESFPIKVVMISILGIAMLVWIIITIMGALCSI